LKSEKAKQKTRQQGGELSGMDLDWIKGKIAPKNGLPVSGA
jgi:hypothetical protein